VPLGDLIDRRRLIIGQGILSVVALVAVAAARTEAILFAQPGRDGSACRPWYKCLVAFAATLAMPAERGKAVGMVTSAS